MLIMRFSLSAVLIFWSQTSWSWLMAAPNYQHTRPSTSLLLFQLSSSFQRNINRLIPHQSQLLMLPLRQPDVSRAAAAVPAFRWRRQVRKGHSYIFLKSSCKDSASLAGGGFNGPGGSDVASLNVIVTGANRGLGFAIADHMACLGHRVVLACRSEREVCGLVGFPMWAVLVEPYR